MGLDFASVAVLDKEEKIDEWEVALCFDFVKLRNDPLVSWNIPDLVVAEGVCETQASMKAVTEVTCFVGRLIFIRIFRLVLQNTQLIKIKQVLLLQT